MTQANAERKTLPWALRAAVLVAMLLPVVAAAVFVGRYAVNLPFYEEWGHLDTVAKWREGRLNWADLWAQYNESRKVISRLVVIALSTLGLEDLRAQMALNLALCAATALMIAVIARRTLDAWGAALISVLGSVLLMSLAQWQNFLWANQFICAVPGFGLMGILLLVQARWNAWVRLAAAIAIAVATMLTFANGLVLWPLGALALTLSPELRKPRFFAIWFVAGALLMVVYFRGLVLQQPNGVPLFTPTPGNVAYAAAYFTMEFAAPYLPPLPVRVVPPTSPWSAPLWPGLAMLLLIAVSVRLVARKRVPWERWGPWIIVIGYCVLSAALIAWGRCLSGLWSATLPRYTTYTLPTGAGLCALLWLASKPRWAVTVAAVLVAALALRAEPTLEAAAGFKTKLKYGVAQVLFCRTAPEAETSATIAEQRPGFALAAERYTRLGLIKPGVLIHPDLHALSDPVSEGRVWVEGESLSGEVTARRAAHAALLALVGPTGFETVVAVAPVQREGDTWRFSVAVPRDRLSDAKAMRIYLIDVDAMRLIPVGEPVEIR